MEKESASSAITWVIDWDKAYANMDDPYCAADAFHLFNIWLYHNCKRVLASMGRCTNCGSESCPRKRGEICD